MTWDLLSISCEFHVEMIFVLSFKSQKLFK